MMKFKRHSQRTINKGYKHNERGFGQWLRIVAIIVFLLFIVRFGSIAIFKDVKNHDLKSAAQQRYTQSQFVRARRGKITDAQGNILAEDSNTYTVYAVLDHQQKDKDGKPKYVANKRKTARILSGYLDMSEDKIYKDLNPSKKGVFQVQFGPNGSNLSVNKMEEIKSRNLPGIKFIKNPARQYPEGNFARQLIGLASPVTNKKTMQVTLVGRLGLEKDLNKELSGRNGIKKSSTALYGSQLRGSKGKTSAVENGDSVKTTLDNRIQQQLENRIDNVYDQAKPSAMSAVLMEAKTGKIIAATQRPNLKSKKPVWTNALTQDTYEPGSTMKVIALSAAIDSGHFNPDATYHSGTWELGGGKVTDWDQAGWGDITYREAFYRSSNVGFAHIEQNMGANTWKSYLNRFGFFKPVHVYGMSDEFSGYSSFKGALQQSNTAFGQGLTVNTMQMMQAFSAVANNGKMMRPYWIDKVTSPSGKTVKKVKPVEVGHPISASTAKQVRKLMEGVIYDKKGTGQVYQVDGVRLAGKTGTAQIGSAHGYQQGSSNYIYSFVGMFPANKPRYIIYLTMKQPTTLHDVPEKSMATITSSLIKSLMDNHSSSHKKSDGISQVPSVKGLNKNKAQDALSKEHLQVTVLGSGNKVTWQSLPAGSSIVYNNRILLLTSGQVKMPDITNWSQADVSALAQALNLHLRSSGSGFVNEQSITKDTVVKNGQTLEVKFVQH